LEKKDIENSGRGMQPHDFQILVVEDSSTQAEILRWTLAEKGYQVAVAENGATALGMIRKAKPSLVISDIVMPVMDGYTMCHEIKQDDQLKDIPVILLTDLSDPKDVIKGLHSKADNYVTKPYHAKLLLSRIESLLESTVRFDVRDDTEALELNYGGECYSLTSSPRQILNLLVSTYENAVYQRHDLIEAQRNLVQLNHELDTKLHDLQESEHRFSILVQMIPDIVYRIDNKGRFTFINNAVEKIGYKPEELVGKHFSEIILPTDVESISSEYVLPKYRGRTTGSKEAPKLFDERRTGERATRNLEIMLVRKGLQDAKLAVMESIGTEFINAEINSSGMYQVVSESGEKQLVGTMGVATAKSPSAKRIGTVGAIRDITERKRREDKLRQSEEWYRSLVEDSFDGIFVQKGQKIIFANSRLYEMLHYSKGELEGMDHWLVYHAHYHEISRSWAAARMRGEKTTPQYEVRLQRKDGSSFIGEISSRLLEVRGEPGIQIWVRDISQKKRSERALRRLAIAVDQVAEAIVITDTKGNIKYVNPAFERITGYSHQEAVGQNPRILKSGQHDSTFYRGLWETITNGEPWTGQLVNKKKDGTLYREDATISPVRDSSGKIVNYVAVKRDITREIELQQQLLQAQKMEAVGTLAGGVAHDFNNLLQVVLGYCDILLRRKSKRNADYAILKKIYDAGKRGADLVRSLLAFSRKVEPKLHPTNLNMEIHKVKELLERTIPKTIKFNLDLRADLEPIQADPSQIGQILMNLGVNARDAMPDGGILTIKTEKVDLDEEYCSSNLEVKPGCYVLLTFSDSGHGMDKQTLEHVFEPFFSTKEVGKGTGLGLATVYGIVKLHGGHITCSSEPRLGTTFNIYLPAHKIDKVSDIPTDQSDIPGGTETILLVEDEDVVRELSTELLDGFGYHVITASNGKEALEIYRREGERISLVILDLIMPEMDGRQCLAEILRVDPNARILIASGYSEQGPGGKDILAKGAMGFVEKPYDIGELLEAIRKILDAD